MASTWSSRSERSGTCRSLLCLCLCVQHLQEGRCHLYAGVVLALPLPLLPPWLPPLLPPELCLCPGMTWCGWQSHVLLALLVLLRLLATALLLEAAS